MIRRRLREKMEWGYSLEFDARGRYDDLTIDFEAMGAHLGREMWGNVFLGLCALVVLLVWCGVRIAGPVWDRTRRRERR